MPHFLSRADVYALLQREEPEDAYPEGAATGSAHGADNGATAKVIGGAYSNLERIYANQVPQTADEQMSDHEILHFGNSIAGGLTLQQRRDRVIAKVRQRRRTTPSDLKQTVYTIIDGSIQVEIVELGCSSGAWILDESELEIMTYLSGWSGVQFGYREDWCTVTAAELGISEQDYLDYRAEVYTYEVRIYGYTLTAEELQQLEQALTENEPSRSQHVILDGLDPADSVEGDG